MWIDATKLNDIDYLNLKGRDEDYDSLVTSKFNYFIANDDHYFGAYAKYYIDTEKIGSKNENKDTLQELPSLQYHKFTDDIVLPNILYSIDLQSHRYDRKIGVRATQYEFTLPASVHVPLFDDSLTFSFYEYLYASRINYENKINSFDDKREDKHANFVNNYHKFALHTDLAKAYESFYHTLNFGAEYLLPGYRKGNLDDEFIYDKDLNEYENFLAQDQSKEEVSGYLTQYFFNGSGRKVVKHSISQGYYTKDDEYSNLKNAIYLYPFENFSVYNKLEYSHKDRELKKVQNGLYYTHDLFWINMLHTMKKSDSLAKNSATKDSYFTSSAGVKLPHQYSLIGDWQYDLERSYTKSWRVGVLHQRKCWNYGLIYQHDVEPTTTTNGSASTKKSGIYFTINFYPMGGLHYDFSQSSTTSSSSK